MTLKITALKAKEGDCLILQAEGALVLVDGGPPGVYSKFLEPRLDELRSELTTGDELLPIDLVIVSHIDGDHIAGVLDLTREIREHRQNNENEFASITNAWHNSFSDMIAGVVPAGIKPLAQTAAASESFNAILKEHAQEDGAKTVLESVKQGHDLGLDFKQLGVHINKQFKDGFVMQGKQINPPHQIGKMKISVIGPTQAQLDDLKEKWEKELPKILAKEPAAPAAAEKLDVSVSNLSSIVCIAKADSKQVLLTGDARGDMILEWLAAALPEKNGKYHFDVVKVPHHGSDHNVNADFFNSVTADHYIISGDGKYGNPEPATLRMIFDSRQEDHYSIHLTYPPEQISAHPKFAPNVSKLAQVLKEKPQNAVVVWPIGTSTELEIVL